MTTMVGWELGLEGDFGLDGDWLDEAGAEFGLDPAGGRYTDTMEAINAHVVDLSRRVDGMVVAGKLTRSKYDKFFKLFDDWKKFYSVTMGSWYVSDDDVNVAKKKRDDINMTVLPEATKQSHKYSAQAKGMSKAEVTEREGESKSFLQKHWLPILGVTLVGGAAVYVSGAALAYLQLAKKSGIIRALGH